MALLTFALSISAAVYLAATATSAAELSFTAPQFAATCRNFGTCWNIFVVAWAIAIAAGVISFFSTAALSALNHQGRLDKLPAILVSVFNAVLWLVVILVGWIPSIGDSAHDSLTSSNVAEVTPPVTGYFLYTVDFYYDVLKAISLSINVDRKIRDEARTGLAASILCTISFDCTLGANEHCQRFSCSSVSIFPIRSAFVSFPVCIVFITLSVCAFLVFSFIKHDLAAHWQGNCMFEEGSRKKIKAEQGPKANPSHLRDGTNFGRTICRNRVFFTTAGGHMGVGFKAMRAGDTVCALFGRITPFHSKKR